MNIAAWLRGLGLERYEPAFRENEIDIEVLPELTELDLSALGLPIGPRRKLLKAIAALRGPLPGPPPLAGEGRVGAEAERRQLTVLFCDLVGSTALSARLDPEDLRAVIGAYHRCVAAVIERSGGFVAKYMGDGVLVYFGYPRAHEHDAERAVRAGLALVGAVAGVDTAAETRLQVRVGIATGLVVVGDLIGEGASQEQAVVGETPNLAARLQALAAPGTVVIGPSTRGLTGGLFDYEDLGPVEIRGLATPVAASRVLRESAAESRFEALRATRTPLVGRDEELAMLERRWQQAKSGEGSIVLLSGEPGIGKSRLAQTFLERLAGEPHTRLRSFCSPHHQDHALYPTIAQLERAAGFRREDTADQRLDKLEAVLAQATNDLREAAPLLAALLSIPAGERYPPLNLTPQKQKERTLRALVAQVEGLAARTPMLLLFEDAHWSDPTSLELFDLIVDRVPALRVLLIVTFRPEFNPPWTGRPHVTALGLSRLAPRQRAEMITGVTGGKALPKEITDQIIDRTDGVPLFVEELTKAVVESGMLTALGDRYTATGQMPALAIPASLQASLLARLDRLAPVREVAQIGAVLGRQFSHELIGAVARMPPAQLDDALAQLVGAELIYHRGAPPDAEYIFKHALVQDAAYGTLLRSRRQQLHAHIAATLEDRFPEIVGAEPALLAHRRSPSPSARLPRNGSRKRWPCSAAGWRWVPGLPDSDWSREREFDLQIALGQSLCNFQSYWLAAGRQAWGRAMLALHGQWLYLTIQADLNRAMQVARVVRDFGETSGDAASLETGCHMRGYIHMSYGEFAQARADFEQSLVLFDPGRRPFYAELPFDQLVCLLANSSQLLVCMGHLDQALSRRHRALHEARQLSRPDAVAMAMSHGWLVRWCIRSNPESLQQDADEYLAFSTEHGLGPHQALGRIYRGWSLAALGHADEGLNALGTGVADCDEIGFMLWRPLVLTLFADVCRIAGQLPAALRHLTEAQRLTDETGERWAAAETLRLRGEVLLAMDDPAAAEASYCEAIAIAQQQSAKLWELRGAMSLARLWRDHGKRIEARNLLAPVYGWFTEGFGTPVLKEAKALLDELH